MNDPPLDPASRQAAELIDRRRADLVGEMAKLRDLIREAHEAQKALKQAVRDAEEAVRQTGRATADKHVAHAFASAAEHLRSRH